MGPHVPSKVQDPLPSQKNEGPMASPSIISVRSQGQLPGGKSRLGPTRAGLRAWLPETPTVTPQPELPVPKR